MSVSWGPRPSSQSCRLASVSAIMPKRGRGGRRERYWRDRRFCGDGSLAARKMRRTVSRLTARLSSAWSFSARWKSLKPWYLPRARLKINCFWGIETAQGMQRPRLPMLYPGYGVGAVAPLQPLHLALTQLQQAGGFAYAQPPARCILNHFHPLELFLTHGHHPSRVTESRCSYGVTLSWSIYTCDARPSPPVGSNDKNTCLAFGQDFTLLI